MWAHSELADEADSLLAYGAERLACVGGFSAVDLSEMREETEPMSNDELRGIK